MKIEKIYFKGLGPVRDALSPIYLRNTWGKKIYTLVLFSGKNKWFGNIQKENEDVDFWLGEIKIGKKERFLLGPPKYVKDTAVPRAKVASPVPGYEEKNNHCGR